MIARVESRKSWVAGAGTSSGSRSVNSRSGSNQDRSNRLCGLSLAPRPRRVVAGSFMTPPDGVWALTVKHRVDKENSIQIHSKHQDQAWRNGAIRGRTQSPPSKRSRMVGRDFSGEAVLTRPTRA